MYYHEYDADKPSDKGHVTDITSTPEQLLPLSKHLSDIFKTSLFKSKMRKLSNKEERETEVFSLSACADLMRVGVVDSKHHYHHMPDSFSTLKVWLQMPMISP